MIFPKSDYNILKLIYENPGIRLNELIRKARISAETSKKRLEHLLKLNIITEKKIIGGKRTLLKNFYPNFQSVEGKNAFSLIESEKKQEFYEKNKNLIGPFQQLLKNINNEIKVILIFGSFASDTKTKDSDLDILFLTSKETEKDILKKEIERSFITFRNEISPRIDTLNNFHKNINNDIYQTIIKNHVVIKGNLEFIELIA